MMLKHVRLDQEGVSMFLGGSLETLIMCVFWEYRRPLSSAMVHKALIRAGHDQGYTTIAAVITRLVKKQLLIHNKHHARYTPTYASEIEYTDYCVNQVLTTLKEQFNYA